MNLRIFATGSTAIALSLAMVSPVAAISVDVDSGANVGVSSSASSSVGNTGAGASGSVNGQSSLKAQVQNVIHSITGGITGKVNTEAQADVGTNDAPDAAVSSNADGNASSGVILFTRGEIEAAMHASDAAQANASENSAFNSIDLNFSGSPASVSSNADLSAFIATTMKNDENLNEVQASSGSVAVTYKEQAKFLGFIPASIKATAIVDAAGNVTISRPWYGFLFSSADRAALEASIESRVQSRLAAEGSLDQSIDGTSGFGELSADTQAQLVADIHAAMQESLAASAAVDVSARANADLR